jgi:hypothetical protein
LTLSASTRPPARAAQVSTELHHSLSRQKILAACTGSNPR